MNNDVLIRNFDFFTPAPRHLLIAGNVELQSSQAVKYALEDALGQWKLKGSSKEFLLHLSPGREGIDTLGEMWAAARDIPTLKIEARSEHGSLQAKARNDAIARMRPYSVLILKWTQGALEPEDLLSRKGENSETLDLLNRLAMYAQTYGAMPKDVPFPLAYAVDLRKGQLRSIDPRPHFSRLIQKKQQRAASNSPNKPQTQTPVKPTARPTPVKKKQKTTVVAKQSKVAEKVPEEEKQESVSPFLLEEETRCGACGEFLATGELMCVSCSLCPRCCVCINQFEF